MFAHGSYSTPPELRIRNNSEEFGKDNVTLILEWTQETVLASYALTVVSLDAGVFTRLDGNTSVQLTLPYNTSFNVSIMKSVCNQTLSSTTITLKYCKIF